MTKYFKIIDQTIPAWQYDKIFIMDQWKGIDTMYSCKINNKEYNLHINQLKEYIPSDLVEVYAFSPSEHIIGYFDDINECFYPLNNDVYCNIGNSNQIPKTKMDNKYFVYQSFQSTSNNRTIKKIYK